MKKILCGIAVVLAMVLATSCGQRQQKNVVEEEVERPLIRPQLLLILFR